MRQIELDLLDQIIRIGIDANLSVYFITTCQPLNIIGKLKSSAAIDLKDSRFHLLDILLAAQTIYDCPWGRHQIARIPRGGVGKIQVDAAFIKQPDHPFLINLTLGPAIADDLNTDACFPDPIN